MRKFTVIGMYLEPEQVFAEHVQAKDEAVAVDRFMKGNDAASVKIIGVLAGHKQLWTPEDWREYIVTPEQTLANLVDLEEQIGKRMGIFRNIRETIISLLKQNVLVEDELIRAWNCEYSSYQNDLKQAKQYDEEEGAYGPCSVCQDQGWFHTSQFEGRELVAARCMCKMLSFDDAKWSHTQVCGCVRPFTNSFCEEQHQPEKQEKKEAECEACGGNGWLCDSGNDIERCDACKTWQTDAAAKFHHDVAYNLGECNECAAREEEADRLAARLTSEKGIPGPSIPIDKVFDESPHWRNCNSCVCGKKGGRCL